MIVHEVNDHDLARRVCDEAKKELLVIDEDSYITKGFLGACYAVVGSRYHSLVSAMSQGTPTMGTSWTHKYDALFEEYECPRWLVSPHEDPSRMDRKIEDFLDVENQRELRAKLDRIAAMQKEKVELMWRDVESLFQSHVME